MSWSFGSGARSSGSSLILSRRPHEPEEALSWTCGPSTSLALGRPSGEVEEALLRLGEPPTSHAMARPSDTRALLVGCGPPPNTGEELGVRPPPNNGEELGGGPPPIPQSSPRPSGSGEEEAFSQLGDRPSGSGEEGGETSHKPAIEKN